MASGVGADSLISPLDSRQRSSVIENSNKLIVESRISPSGFEQQLPVYNASKYISKSQCTLNCESSDEGNENVEYCEDDEAKLNPEDHNLSMEEHHSQPFNDCMLNSDTLFNLTATSP